MPNKNKKKSSTMASCYYSDRWPPECGIKVVVQCDRVDSDYGVFGKLVGYGPNCTAFLPINFVVPERGRGERKAQSEFITKAKRHASKGKPITVVAEVDTIEVRTSTGVDEIDYNTLLENYLVTVTRRGIEKMEEKETFDAHKRTRRCADLLVDKAALKAGVSTYWARNACLYQPYINAVKVPASSTISCDIGDDTIETKPLVAAADILVNRIGRLDRPDVGAMKELLLRCSSCSDDENDEYAKDWQKFGPELWEVCCNERFRSTKPIAFSLSGTVGNLAMISEMVAAVAQDYGSVSISSVASLTNAVKTAIAAEEAPTGCSRVKIVASGAAKLSLTTHASPENEKGANAYLESVLAKVKTLYASNSEGASIEQGAVSKTLPINASTTTHDDDVQPSMNIGLIGDVANGKSTLIRAISGKRTQCHSTENQKHGMTIRLGFANASVLQCHQDGCEKYCFRQDEAQPKPPPQAMICSYCGSSSATLVTRVSFIDCPGHAELMATMLSGASAFDAVIFAAAANTPCPTDQALQHLEALRMTEVDKDRIAIVQTKAELVVQQQKTDCLTGLSGEEKLKLHADNAKSKLAATVAAEAPFFPVCAPMGLGLAPLAEWIAHLPKSKPPSSAKVGDGNFRVLRSFDVNCAGKDATKLVGGVLGGSINGSGIFHTGDVVELRPGLIIGPPSSTGEGSGNGFRVRPLRFQIQEIMTDKTAMNVATSGGLVALRTTLCPSLCADDRLVGSVVGHPGSLPPVFGPSLMLDNLTFATSRDAKELLKKSLPVRCHSGSSTVAAKVVRVSSKRKKIELMLDSPICAFRVSIVAIEAKLGSTGGFGLVAHASITDGSVCLGGEGAGADGEKRAEEHDRDGASSLDGHCKPSSTDAFACDQDCIRQMFSEDLAERTGSNDSLQERISIPAPDVSRDGGSHILIENFAHIAMSLNRDPLHLQAYLIREAGLSSCARAGVHGGALRVRYKARGFAELFRRIVRRYATVYVLCEQCKSTKTEFLKNNAASTELMCRQCNACRFVPKL